MQYYRLLTLVNTLYLETGNHACFSDCQISTNLHGAIQKVVDRRRGSLKIEQKQTRRDRGGGGMVKPICMFALRKKIT